ncbi:SUMF1/EgtB/PvdO family nonheme iron enzyme, partial [Mycobacterium tuberculosis]|nr:SUMF1/EgtB/PvdO family nonheme iron enzyme [Mycobacterium tuberculosis]
WRTRVTGYHWRLPTDLEWAVAAGSRYRDDAVSETAAGDTADPAERWLADYNNAGRDGRARDAKLRPSGGFGVNERGLSDMAGNVWE